MKSRLLFSAICFTLLFACSHTLRAQRIVHWKGGTPGLESNWNTPGNWSTNAVPNAFCDVIIPDVSTRSGAGPVLAQKNAEVNTLILESGASLVIQQCGALAVYGNLERFGVQTLEVNGSLMLKGDAQTAGLISGNGALLALGKSK
ncbi:MAG: hypothetical protein IPM98_13240 [Lewinellaceae bacterium]|nr:hypothetical protein [Lewinellaceae bacterium]